ncbi:hypothetical protein [Streptomyces sp. WELS2]|uniref:hypothetical protein n=1 Tax=Streptomyces sp. WELS2 TaxID=2749435 RepID=UPI0015F05A4F|nr:hypothetical protein [Streptomyces sp. WELS2]
MNALAHSGAARRRPTGGGAGVRLLGIYLNDHLAGATAGTERAARLARAARGSALGRAIEPVAAEIAEDRAALLDIMRDLGVPARRYKVCAGWAAEKMGRLKPNGHLVRPSPLGTLLDLEALRLGVEGKAACWQILGRLAADDERLDSARLSTLLERARRQQETLEEWRVRQAGEALAAAAGRG